MEPKSRSKKPTKPDQNEVQEQQEAVEKPAERFETLEETAKTQQSIAEEVANAIAESNRSIAEGMATYNEAVAASLRAAAPQGIRYSAPDQSDVVDELEKGGPAFGAFVKAVGLAVAEAQQKLDETLVTTAEALSKQEINVVAVFEQEINDENGEMAVGSGVKLQKLPLINYLMPTAYQWSRVYLEADMKVQEFNAKSGFVIKQKTERGGLNGGVGYGLTGFGFNLGGGYSNSFSETSGNNEFGSDSAVGSLHMEATLEPRSDIRLPQPYIVQKGPRLQVFAGGAEDIKDTGNPPKVVGRQVTLTATLLKSNGDANTGKQLGVRLDQPTVNFSFDPAEGKTNDQGELKIMLKREGAAYQPGTTVQVQVRVWFGLVSELIVVSI